MKPRIRTIKPEMWQSRDFRSVPRVAQTLFICLINHADDDGRLKTDAAHIEDTMLNVPLEELQVGLDALSSRHMIVQYAVAGEPYVALVNWEKHQKISHRKPSDYPAPPRKRIPAASGKIRNPPVSRAGADPDPDPDHNPDPDPASSNEDALAHLKALRRKVCELWKARHEWAGWPRERRYDAVQITEWLRHKPYPIEFWAEAIERVPKGAAFTYLTTPPERGKVPRLEEWFGNWRDSRYEARKANEVADMRSVGDILRGVA